MPAPVVRRYSVGGNVAWLAWHPDLPVRCLEALLPELGLSGVALTGTWRSPFLGKQVGQAFAERLLQVFDPQQKFRYPSLSNV
jgi:hypothetical protein